MKFCEALKLLRTELSLTQDELAGKLGTTKQVLSRYETDARVPTLDVVQEWERLLDVPAGVLTSCAEIPQGFLESYPGSLTAAYAAWQAAVWASMMDGWNPAEGATAELLQLWRRTDPMFQRALLNLLRAHLR